MNMNDLIKWINTHLNSKMSVKDVKQLSILDLSGRNIKELHPDLNKLDNLVHLDISNNEIDDIGTINELISYINHFYANSNKIKEFIIPNQSFNLESLFLDNNELESINLDNALFLKKASFNENKLKQVNIINYSLERIDLANNQIKTLILNTPYIIEIEAYHNNIKELSIDTFSKIENILFDKKTHITSENLYTLFQKFGLDPILIQNSKLSNKLF